MVRSAAAPVAPPLHGAGVLETEMTIGGVVAHQPGEDPHVGGASAAVEAGLSPETGGGRGPSPGTGTTNLRDLSLDQGAAPDLMTENRRSLSSVKGVEENGCTDFAVSYDGHLHGLKVIFVLSFFLNNRTF